MASSVNIPKSARDILLAKAGEFVVQATEKRSAGDHGEAFSLYQRAAEIIEALITKETDENFKLQLEKQLQDISVEKETVAIEEKALINVPSSEDARSRRDSTACEVVMTIENISIHRIVGLGERQPERELIGTGILRILRCQPPPESPSSQKPVLETMSESKLESDLKEERKTTKQEGLCLLQLIPLNDETQFQFPLTKSIPCLCTSPGYYIFPMPDNLFYGLVFPSEIPPAYVNVFEGVLEDCCNMRKVHIPAEFHPSKQAPSEADEKALTTISTSTEIIVAETTPLPLAAKALNVMSSGINTGANALVDGITTGSHYIVAGARTGGDFIRRNITPSPEPAKVPEPVVTTVYVASKLSPVCVAVSKVLINSLAALADEVGKTVAKGIKSSGSGKSSGPSGPTVTAAKSVGKTSLQAVVNVWEALEQAGKLIMSETSDQTVGIVETKYGPQAAQVTKEGMQVAGDVITTAYNLDQLGLKKIATKAAKQAGKHTVKELMGGDKEKEQLALPAPEEKLALPAPQERLALPAPEDKQPAVASSEQLALPAPEH